jgi:uncharacterized membrane protein
MPPPNLPFAGDEAVAPVVRRNISALADMRAAEDRRLTPIDRFVEAVTRFAGSMKCVCGHAAVISSWVFVNLGWVHRVRPFDPPPYELLVSMVAIEAIFLSMFILISQNRARVLAERRAELHLQIGLLTEHELTRAVHLLDAVADRLGVRHGDDLSDVKRDVHPEHVVDEIVRAEDAAAAAGESGDRG